MQSLNWSELIQQAGEGGRTLVDKGTWNAIVESAEAGNDTSGNPAIVARFQFTDQPWVGVGARLKKTMSLNPEKPGTISFFFEHMAGLGLPKEWFAQLPAGLQTLSYIAGVMKGRQCRLEINNTRDFNGRKVNDIERILPPGGQVSVAAPQQAVAPQYGAPQFPGQPQPFAAPQFPQPQAAPAPLPDQPPAAPPAAPSPYRIPQQPAAAPLHAAPAPRGRPAVRDAAVRRAARTAGAAAVRPAAAACGRTACGRTSGAV